jgi:hypothetical protein
MWTRLILILVLALSGGAYWSPPADASCVVRSTATYSEGTSLRDDECDTSGARKVTTGGAAGATSGTANAAAPTYVEGSTHGNSYDLSGNLRSTNGTLNSCEYQGTSQLNSRLQTGGAQIITDTLASAVTTNTTSTAVIAYTGPKTIYGQVVCSSGACVQTQAIYGDIDNDAANGILLCTLTLSGTTRAQDACTVITAAFKYFYVITTATSGTSAAGAVYAQY